MGTKAIKPLSLVIFLLAAMVLLAPAATAQDEVMFLNSEELGAHSRALVRFTHQKHSDAMAKLADDEEAGCMACHHDRKVYGVPGDSTGERCAQCHAPGSDNPVPLKMAMHKQCKNCHRSLKAQKKSTGPVICGQCHVNGVEPPAK